MQRGSQANQLKLFDRQQVRYAKGQKPHENNLNGILGNLGQPNNGTHAAAGALRDRSPNIRMQ